MRASTLRFPPHRDACHVWSATTSPLIERCTRPSCRAIRQWRDGTWIVIDPQHQQRHGRTAPTHHPGLWSRPHEQAGGPKQ